MASWSFVESAFGKDGYFKIVQSGYSFFVEIKHPVIFLSKSNWHPPKIPVQNVAPRLKRKEKQRH